MLLTSAYDYSYYHSKIEVSLTRRDIKILKVIFFISLVFFFLGSFLGLINFTGFLGMVFLRFR